MRRRGDREPTNIMTSPHRYCKCWRILKTVFSLQQTHLIFSAHPSHKETIVETPSSIFYFGQRRLSDTGSPPCWLSKSGRGGGGHVKSLPKPLPRLNPRPSPDHRSFCLAAKMYYSLGQRLANHSIKKHITFKLRGVFKIDTQWRLDKMAAVL